jgi:hypothetical protein
MEALTASALAKLLRSPELSECADAFWLGQDGDGIGLKAGAGSLPGFELAIEDNGGKGEFLFWGGCQRN